jgi:hypothetical protein
VYSTYWPRHLGLSRITVFITSLSKGLIMTLYVYNFRNFLTQQQCRPYELDRNYSCEMSQLAYELALNYGRCIRIEELFEDILTWGA